MDLVEEDREKKEQAERDKLSKKRMVEKANNYAKYVREMYAPQISEDNVLTKFGKENLRGNSVEEPEVIGIINPGRKPKDLPTKRPARRNTAENKYNNVRIHLQSDNQSSLGPPPSDSQLDSRRDYVP